LDIIFIIIAFIGANVTASRWRKVDKRRRRHIGLANFHNNHLGVVGVVAGVVFTQTDEIVITTTEHVSF